MANVHITHIGDTEPNVRTDADPLQAGVNTTTNEWWWMDSSATNLHYANKQVVASTGVTTYKDLVFNDVTVNGDLYTSEYHFHLGDTNTYDRWRTDQKTTVCGGVVFMDMVEGGTDYTTFFTNLLYIDNTNERICVGANSPRAKLHLIDGAVATGVTALDSGFLITDGTGYPRIILEDPSGTSGDRVMDISLNGDVFKIRALADNAASVLVDNILCIDPTNGNVGLGIVPQSAFHLSRDEPLITITDTTYGADSAIQVSSNGELILSADINADRAASFISFRVDGNGLSSEALRIDASKNIAYLTDNVVQAYGADSDVTLTHIPDTALRFNTTMGLQFRDAGILINSIDDGYMDLTADTAFRFNTGNVGIQVADPFSPLTISGTLSNEPYIFVNTDSDITNRVLGVDGAGGKMVFGGYVHGTTTWTEFFNYDGSINTFDIQGGLIVNSLNGTADSIFYNDAGDRQLFLDAGTGNSSFGKNSLETWNTGYTVVQHGKDNAVMSTATGGAVSLLGLLNNMYFDTSADWRRVSADESAMIRLDSGDIRFYNEVSGAADGVLSLSETLILHSDKHASFGSHVNLADSLEIRLGDGEDIAIDFNGTNFDISCGSNIARIATPMLGVNTLPIASRGVLQVGTPTAVLGFVDSDDTGTASTANGYIEVVIAGDTRYVQLYDSVA